MTCKATRTMLSRYLDHELTTIARGSVEAHLSQCTECQAAYATQQRVWDLLERALPIEPPDVLAAVEARLAEPRGWAALLAGLRLRTVAYTTAAVALVGLFVTTGIWAGSANGQPAAKEQDGVLAELLGDAPPGLEIGALLDDIGEKP